MSNGIGADGTRQTKTPLTGERIVGRLKDGRFFRGMYQDGRIYGGNREAYHMKDVTFWGKEGFEIDKAGR